jgi:beta-1,2-mannosidase
MKYNYIHLSALCLLTQIISSPAQTVFGQVDSPVKLCSPKDGDHFEVTEPLLFWKAIPGDHYEIYVDDAKVGDAPAGSGPVLNYGLTAALAPGEHHWLVKAIPASGAALSSAPSNFTVEAPGNWPAWTIGPFVRYGENPIIKPIGDGWESLNTYNPGVLFDDGKFRMLYRGQPQKPWVSRIGYAESTDGVTFLRDPKPLIDMTKPFEKVYGCEDPRFFKYEDTYYTFYTGNIPDTHDIAICEATSKDGTTWEKLGPVVPKTKNAAVVCDPSGTPVKINGKFVMYCGNSGFGISYSDDLLTWTPMAKIDMKLPADWVAPYEPCVAVCDPKSAHPDDIVLFIAGTLNGKGKWYYAISEVLFDKSDLTTKAAQLDDCILKPREPYESGQFPHCLWTNGIIQHNGQWMLYYGAGDRNVGLATAPVDK